MHKKTYKIYLSAPSASCDHLVIGTRPFGVQSVAGAVGCARVERLARALGPRALRGHLRDREDVALGTRPDGIWRYMFY